MSDKEKLKKAIKLSSKMLRMIRFLKDDDDAGQIMLMALAIASGDCLRRLCNDVDEGLDDYIHNVRTIATKPTPESKPKLIQ